MAGSIYEDIYNVYTRRGYNIVYGNHFDLVEIWLSWYRGNVNNFHYYNLSDSMGATTPCEMKTLNMAKKACEDFAKYEYAEESGIIIENDDEANKELQEILEENSFYECFKELLEKSKALGDGYIVPYLHEGNITLDFVNSQDVVITSYHNKKIKSLLLLSQFVYVYARKECVINHLQHYVFNKAEGKNIITHEFYKSSDKRVLGTSLTGIDLQTMSYVVPSLEGLSKLETNKNGDYFVEIEAAVPLFSRLRPAIANNYDIRSAYGISRFANSIDTLKAIDTKYDLFDVEFTNGYSQVFVDDSLMEIAVRQGATQGTSDNKLVRYFNPKSAGRKYQVMKGLGDNNGKDKIKHVIPELRTQAITDALNTEVALYGTKFGLGKNYYEFKSGVLQHNTATEVKLTHNDKNVSISDDRKITEAALINMVKAIFSLTNIGKTQGKHDVDNFDIQVKFDDSILMDDETEYAKDLALVNENMMSKKEFLTTWKNVDEKEAQDMLDEAEEESKKSQEAFFGGDKKEDSNEDEEIEDEPNEETENGIS